MKYGIIPHFILNANPVTPARRMAHEISRGRLKGISLTV
jgi:hypothetical protein